MQRWAAWCCALRCMPFPAKLQNSSCKLQRGNSQLFTTVTASGSLQTQPHRKGHLQGRVQLRQELLEQLQHPVSRLIGLSSQLCLLDMPQVPQISGTQAQVSRRCSGACL